MWLSSDFFSRFAGSLLNELFILLSALWSSYQYGENIIKP